MTVEETVTQMTPVAGGDEVVETQPAVQEQPVVKNDGTMNDEDWQTFALGTAARMGWRPEDSRPQAPAQAHETVPGTDFPVPVRWDTMSDGERDAYTEACRVAQATVKQTEDRVGERIARLEGSFGRDRVLSKAKVGLSDDVRTFFDQAVESLERENGHPISQDHPVMVKLVQDRAKALYFDSGAWRKNLPPGETAASTTAPGPIAQNIKDAYTAEFKKDPNGWCPSTDEEWRSFLKEAGHIV